VPAAEAALQGQALTPATAARAAEAALAKATPMAQNKYKVTLAQVILKRALLAASGAKEIGG
jgi:CO/xanthine dehydrogenase FAD-binding subunit